MVTNWKKYINWAAAALEGALSSHDQTLRFSGQRNGAPSHLMLPFHAGNNQVGSYGHRRFVTIS